MRPFPFPKRTAAVLALALSGCAYEYNNPPALQAAYDRLADRPVDTLIAVKGGCDSCRVLRVLQGSAAGPGAGSEFEPAGTLPLDLLDPRRMRYDPDVSFRLVGKVLDQKSASGRPLFYVSSFHRFPFRPAYWTEKSAAGLYPRRYRMVQGMADNLLFNGHPLRELTALLGAPDTVLPGRVSYRVDDNRGGETDPAKASKLDILFGADSVVTGQEIIDPLTGVK